jgi:hypothetical protein
MLDRQGLSARNIADQLGHARISMTQDVYMCRRAVDQAAAAVLEGISPPGHDGDDKPPAVSGSRQSLECGFFWRSNGTVK